MKKALLVILSAVLILSLASFFVSADDEIKVAKVIYGTPIIDGDIDAIWDGAQILKPEIVYQDDNITEPTKVQFRIMYDEEYLYFLVEVEDATMSDLEWEKQSLGGNLWRRDGISFTFSPDNNRDITTGQVAPAFWFIIGAFGNTANWNNSPLDVFITEEKGFELTDAGDFDKIPLDKRMYVITYKKDASGNLTGYNYEMKVNLKPKYENIKLEPGTEIGFDLYSNDNNYMLFSTSRNYGLAWCSINSYKNNAEKGVLQLQERGVTFDNPVQTEPVTEPETTPAQTEPVTEPETTPAQTEPVTEPETTPEATVPQTTPETTPASSGKKGCGGFAGAGLVLVTVIGTALIAKKRD